MTVQRDVTAGATGRHVPAIDGLRGLAVLLVMIHHNFVMLFYRRAAITTHAESMAYQIFSAGWLGVELFFVLSGFLITGILLDSKTQPHYWRNFYARRVLRIFPLFYLLAIFSFVILPHLPLPSIKAARFNSVGSDQWMYWIFLVNVAIAKVDVYRHGIMDVAWSLSIEEQFYLLWPLVVLVLRQRTLMIISAVIIAASPLLRMIAWEIGLSGKQIYVLTPFRLDGLAAGALLACATRSPIRDRWIKPMFGGALIVGGLILFIGTMLIAGNSESEGYLISIVGLSGGAIASLGLLMAILSLPAEGWLIGFLSSSPMRMFGKYSYALYLVHLPLRALLRDRVIKPEHFGSFPGGAFVGQAVFYVVSISLALVVAIASWYIIERPALSLKRYFPNIERPESGPGEFDPKGGGGHDSSASSPLGYTTNG